MSKIQKNTPFGSVEPRHTTEDSNSRSNQKTIAPFLGLSPTSPAGQFYYTPNFTQVFVRVTSAAKTFPVDIQIAHSLVTLVEHLRRVCKVDLPPAAQCILLLKGKPIHSRSPQSTNPAMQPGDSLCLTSQQMDGGATNYDENYKKMPEISPIVSQPARIQVSELDDF